MPDFSNPIPKSTPKDVFYNLLSIVTLYAAVISFIALLWQYVNVWFPDPLNYYYQGILISIRWSVSVLVVMFPVYVLMSWLIHKDFALDPARREIKVRKWLVYLTLFVSAITVIIDVITLVYNLFGGELTVSFFLKVLSVLVVAAGVFGYYFWDLRGAVKNLKVLAWVVSAIVVIVVVGGFFLVGSPAHQRSLKFDEQRVSDLQSIQSQTINYWQQKNQLPANLDNLTDSISGFKAPKDPETGQAYEYSVQSNLSFQLCANFNLPSETSSEIRAIPMKYPTDNWNHGSGRVCFDRTIDPELYKFVPLK